MPGHALMQLAMRLQTRDIGPDIDTEEPADLGTEEILSSWALFILMALLIGSLLTSYFLQIRKIRAVHETVISIFAGMIVGLIIRVSPGHNIQEMVSFNYSYFFNLLLPPIILNSGYELHQANFFRNLGSILTFAFAGTFISAIVLGGLLYLWSFFGFENMHISFVDALSVGATLSATDPVTILAIFNAYKVDPKLYTVIFGESILNDAVAIVMFETAQKFHGKAIYLSSLFKGIGIFLIVFTVSLIIGVLTGIFTALLLKHSYLRRFPGIESCLILLLAYSTYLFSNGCRMSGIVSLLFCGITLKHYAFYNMSNRTQLTTKYLFSVLARLSENFIFIYLGISLFTEVELIYKPLFILVTVFGICIARWFTVFPLSKAINAVARTHSQDRDNAVELPKSYQVMLFWAGLRGAVGVALAAGLKGEYANSLRTTVLVVVVLTVIVFGGTTARMLEILGIETGVTVNNDSDDESIFDQQISLPKNRQFNLHKYQQHEPGNDSPSASSDVPLQRSFRSQSTLSDNESDLGLPPSAVSRRHSHDVSSASNVERKERSDSRGLIQLFQSSTEEHARWFTSFDENVVKPMLLHQPPETREQTP